MKKFCFALGIISCIILSSLCFTGCESVVPGAWTQLKVEGYEDGVVVYTSHMYSSGGPAIVFYENAEDAANDRYYTKSAIEISFYPRILGKNERNGVDTTIVDVSKKQSMNFVVSKSSDIYAADKSVYLNGVKLTPDPATLSDSEYLLIMHFEDLKLVRGNPGGHANDIINVIEYK